MFMKIQCVLNVLKNHRLEFLVSTILKSKQEKKVSEFTSFSCSTTLFECSNYNATVGVIRNHEHDYDTMI